MKDMKHVRVVAALISRGDRYLITQRKPTAFMPLLWEFPGGRVEEGETDEHALERELYEGLGIKAIVGEHFLAVQHDYEDFSVDFHVYRCEIPEEEPRTLGVHAIKWVTASEIDLFQFPPADQPTVKTLTDKN